MKFRTAIFPFVALGFGACATTRPTAPSDSPEAVAAKFPARTLQDAGLRAFLVDNLGHEPAAWDFEALSWAAFYFHPSLGLARAQWATTRAAQQTAGARPNPTITLTPGFNPIHDAGISPWFPSVNLDFLLLRTDKRDRQQDIARADAEAARLAVLSAAWQVHLALGVALIDVETAERRETSLHTQAGLQRDLLALWEQRLAAGSAAAAELVPVRLAWLRAETAETEAGTQRLTARTRVATALGLPVAALAAIKLPVPPASAPLAPAALAAARQQSLQSRSDVLAALAKLRSLESALALETAKQKPDFHLGPGYQWDQGASKWSVALTFELPIFHRNEGPIGEAAARRDEAAAQVVAVQAQVVTAIETAAAAHAAAKRLFEQARRVRGEIEKQNDAVARRLALGAADQVERQAARLDLAVAEAALAEAEAAVALATGQLEDALQIPLPSHAAVAAAARVQSTRMP